MTDSVSAEPEQLGQVLARRPALSGSKPGSISSSEQLPIGPPAKAEPAEFGRAIAYLCAMKRTATLTAEQLDAWHAALGSFRIEIINAAVIEICLTETRFPELGDIYKLCRRGAIKCRDFVPPFAPYANDDDYDKPTKIEIQEVADRLGLKV